MATAWSLDPTTKAAIVEPIILALHSRKEDFMGHPPVIAFSNLRLAPNKLRHDAKAPIFHDLVGNPVIGIGKRPQMDVAPLCRKFAYGQCFQVIHPDIHIRQNGAFDRPWRVDHDTAHSGFGAGELD